MNKKEFKIEYVLDYKKYKEFSNSFNVTNIKMLMVLILFLLLMIINLYQENYKDAILVAIIILSLALFGKKIQFKKQLNFNNNEELDRSIIINDEKITATSKRGNATVIDFDQIVGIIESDNLIILKLKYNKGITIDKNNIIGGTKEELIEFLINKCNIKIKSAKTWSIIRIIIVLIITIIGIIVILCK